MNEPRIAPTPSTTQPEDFALETFLPYRLSLLSNTVSEGIASAYRDQHGLSVTEWRVLAILGRYAGITASAITERGAMDKVTVSRAVRRLHEKGLVARTAQHDDRRRVALELTRSGIRLFNAVVPEALAFERRLLESLTMAERAQLDGLLARLLTAARALQSADASDTG